MPACKVFNVLNIRFPRDGQASCLESTYAELNSIEGHHLMRLRMNVINKCTAAKNAGRYFRLELRFTCEDYSRRDGFGWKEVQQFLYCANMPQVLENWILEPELAFEEDLRPARVFCIREDPALIVLGLYDKDTESGNEDVVNLSCSIL